MRLLSAPAPVIHLHRTRVRYGVDVEQARQTLEDPTAVSARRPRRMPTRPRRARSGQRSFDDLGAPLNDVTFCVVDLETTGTSADDEICEIGAVKVRAGETLGTFQTFVNPGRGIPPLITTLTGITHAHVGSAPRIDDVLGSLLEFIGSSVIVGHNVSFDLGFIDRACERAEYDRPTNTVVDTLGLARRLVRDEVPNCKLSTLASHLCLPSRPTHRALDDALATADLLHLLMERAGAWGVTALEELLELPLAGAHPMAHKLKLTTRLPRAGGIYLFRDGRGTTLYVGKAANLRSRVRSYFSTDERKKVGTLLSRTERIDFKRTGSPIESELLELRLIQALDPEFNKQGKLAGDVYIVVDRQRPTPKLTVTKRPADDTLHLGPFPRRGTAQRIVDAVQTALQFDSDTTGHSPDRHNPDRHGPDRFDAALFGDPSAVLDAMDTKMAALAASQQYERAAEMRDHIDTYIRARVRQHRIDQLRRAGTIIAVVDDLEFRLVRGVMTHYRSTRADGQLALDEPWIQLEAAPQPPDDDLSAPIANSTAEQLLVAARWLEASADRIRICFVSGELTSDVSLMARAHEWLSPIASSRARHRRDHHRMRPGDDRPGSGRRMAGHTALTRPAPRSA